MNEQVSVSVYGGLSDSLSAAIDTGNAEEVAEVLAAVSSAQEAGQLGYAQVDGLFTDARIAGYDF